jgi:hypothetical protein
METRSDLFAIAGVGIEGDRYAKGVGFFSHNKGLRRQVTLFETEDLETILRDHNKQFAPSECRMILITREATLTHLGEKPSMPAGPPFAG